MNPLADFRLPHATGLITRMVLSGAAAIAALWILGAFVDALHLSIRQGEALRESQRSGSPIAAAGTVMQR